MTQVSIIIPTRNRADWLPRAIESAKRAGTGVEVIVVDDASTDATPEICRATTGIRYLRLEQNAKLAGARNAGIRISSGEYLAFLDDDDLRLPQSLDPQIKLLNSDPSLGFVYGRVQFGDPVNCAPTGETSPDELLTGDIFWRLLDGNFIHIPSVVTRRKLVEQLGSFDTTVPGLEDWMMWIRISECHTVGAIDESVAIYRTFSRSSGQLSSNVVAMCTTAAHAQAKGLQLPRARQGTSEKRREVRNRFLDGMSWMLVNDAVDTFLEGNYRRAGASYAAALRLNPRRAARPYSFKLLIAERRKRRNRRNDTSTDCLNNVDVQRG